MPRCLTQAVKLSILVGAALLSVGWALAETRSVRRLAALTPRIITAAALPVEEPAPLPRPLPAPLPPPLPAKAPPPAVAHLSGRIVDEHGQPRKQARADLDMGDLCIWIYADENGHFEADLPPGSYTILARSDADHGESLPQSLNLNSGDNMSDVVLEVPIQNEEVETGIHIEQPSFDD
jgi:hypothetical protein